MVDDIGNDVVSAFLNVFDIVRIKNCVYQGRFDNGV